VSGASDRPWRLAAALCGVVVALDQAAKALAESALYPGQQVDLIWPLDLTLAHNRGIAFGLAGDGGGLLIAFTVISLCFIGWLFARDPQRSGMWVAVGLLVGGALGNLVDRVRADAVTDYIDVLGWPPFNVADIAITVGVGLLAIRFLTEPR